MKKLRITIVALMLVMANSAAALAVDPLAPVCQGAGASSPVCQNTAVTENPVLHIINVAVDLIAILAGVAAVIIIILGALSYVTSGGKPESVTKARSRIFGALIGLVIIALAWTIIHFVTEKLFGK